MLRLVGFIVAFLVVGAVVLEVISQWGISVGENGGSVYQLEGVNETVWSVHFVNVSEREIYDEGTSKKFEINLSECCILREDGNTSFRDAIIKLLGTSPKYLTPEQYSTVVGLAGFLELQRKTGNPETVLVGPRAMFVNASEFAYVLHPLPLDNLDAENYTKKVLVFKYPRLDVSLLNVTYPPSADAYIYNISYLSDYVFVYGWADYDFREIGSSIVFNLYPYLQVYYPDRVERVDLEPITHVFDLSGDRGKITKSFTREFGYYNGQGPLGYAHVEATRECVSNEESTSCVRYISKIDFRYKLVLFKEVTFDRYIWLQIYHGSTPDRKAPIYVVVSKTVNGHTKLSKTAVMNNFDFPYWQRWGYVVLKDEVWGYERKDVTYTVSVCDNITVSGENIDRCYEVLKFNVTYTPDGNLPQWNGYGEIGVGEEVKDFRVYPAPEWCKTDFKFHPNVEAGRRYLLYNMLNITAREIAEFVNKTISANNSRYVDYEKFILASQIPAVIVKNKESNNSVLYVFEYKEGNYTSLGELGALTTSLVVNSFYFDTSGWYYESVMDINYATYNTTAIFSLVRETPVNSPFVQNVSTSCGLAVFSEFGYQSMMASWIWLRNGTYSLVYEGLPPRGSAIPFGKGWVKGWGIEWIKKEEQVCEILDYRSGLSMTRGENKVLQYT